MKAAKNFKFGDGEKSLVFKVGDDIPAKIAKELDDDFILEKVAKNHPELLTRDQLLFLAGITHEDGSPVTGGEEVSEDEFRQGMAEISNKRDLASWAKEFFALDLDEKMSRPDMEDYIVKVWSGEYEEAEVEA